MGRVLQLASFSLASVIYSTGPQITYQILESVSTATFTVTAKSENVSGVVLPAFEPVKKDGQSEFGLTGLGRGGREIQKCRETYVKAVETLVELASLQVRRPGCEWCKSEPIGRR
jgi:V-type H+-transporting ATPase subunit D